MVEAFNVSAYNNGLLDLVSVVGDTIYVCFSDGITGYELWAHDTSNHSTWQVADINSGSGDSNPGSNGAYTGAIPRVYAYSLLVGDTIYFRATNSSSPNNYEIWAHDTSNHSTWQVTDIGPSSSFAGYMIVLIDDTIYLDFTEGLNGNYGYNNGHELWAIQPAVITSLPPPPNMTDVTGATCSISPSLPTGLSIDSSTCTISGTPTVASSNTTYTVTAVMSGVTYQTTVWLSIHNRQLTPSVEGADLSIDVPMTNITFEYNTCLLYTSPSPRDRTRSRMPSSA